MAWYCSRFDHAHLGVPKAFESRWGRNQKSITEHYSARLGAAKLTFPEITRFERGPRCLVMLSLVVLPFALSAVDGDAQNVVQVDRTQGGQCSTNGVVTAIPGLGVSLTTTGSPVDLARD